jgi:hypothetical protein
MHSNSLRLQYRSDPPHEIKGQLNVIQGIPEKKNEFYNIFFEPIFIIILRPLIFEGFYFRMGQIT